jgi:HEAT repeat protein
MSFGGALVLFAMLVVNAQATDDTFMQKFQALSAINARSELVATLENQTSDKVRVILERIAADTKEDNGIRMQALCALSSSANAKSVPLLMDILETDMTQRHGYWGCAIPLLGGLKDRSAIPLLIRVAQKNEDHMAGMDHMAIKAVARLGDEREIEFLAGKAYVYPVRLAILEGLGRIASEKGAAVLIDALQGAEEPEMVKAAQRGLLKTGKPALAVLKKALKDNRDKKSRSRIKKLISKIGG